MTLADVHFFLFRPGVFSFGKFFPKNQNFRWSWNLELEYGELNGNFFCLLFVFFCLSLFFVLFFIFRWGTRRYMSLFQSISPPVRRVPYLKNRTSSSHNFWYTCVKWRYLQVFFIFSFFWNFRVKGQKMAQNAK